MKLSSKALACGQSPMRKFHPYAVAAAAAGKKIYHLNIGQPDIHTPDALYDAIHNFRTPVLAYAASPGIPELIEAIRKYYENIGVGLDESDILITTGGSEALQIAANCLLDDGDEVIVPEPFYPNYHTFITTAGGVIHPLHTKPEEGYFYADRARIEACITPKTKAIMITNPGNPTGTCLTEEQMKMLLDVAVEHDLYLVADEVYREFTYDGEPLHSFGKFDYGKILPQAVLDIPKYGAINMHGSILPQLRGSAPVQRSILNHCDEAGVTAMYLSAGMDEGDIIEIRKTLIQPLETSEELMARLAQIAAPLCADTVRAIETGTAVRIPQDSARATYAPMLSKEESPIDWKQPARFIVDHVRGLVPWPVATAELGGTEFKIYRVEYADQKTDKAPGALVALTKKGLLVACKDGDTVLIRELQAKGGKRMPAPDYFRGHPITIK